MSKSHRTNPLEDWMVKLYERSAVLGEIINKNGCQGVKWVKFLYLFLMK